MLEKFHSLKFDFYQMTPKQTENSANKLSYLQDESTNSNYNREENLINSVTSRGKKSRLLSLKRLVSESKSPDHVSISSNIINPGENNQNLEKPIINSTNEFITSINNQSFKGKLRINQNSFNTDISPLEKSIKNINSNDHQRIKTPNFLKNNKVNMQELKEMCERLVAEQNKMKEQIISQHHIIENLNLQNSSLTPLNSSPIIERRSIPRCRTIIKKRLPIYITPIKDSESLKTINSNKFPNLNIASLNNSSRNSPRDKQQENINVPFIFCKKSELSFLRKLSPMKYYKDTPKIIKNSRLPKDIFIVKK